jgi:sugar O-acyltransferase (sialic acid O-acetyltransferase NeuD family)
MKDIAIFGAGGFGREIACMIELINGACENDNNVYRFVGFFDDGVEKGKQISHFGKVLGGMNELNNWPTLLHVVIAIGNPSSLRFVQERIDNKNISFPNLIHPSSIILDKQSFSIGKGNIIQGNCYMSCDTAIGDFNVLNGSIALGHDAKIGNYNIIMPNTRISGEVTIGNGNLLGVSSIVLQQIKIGDGVRLGAGAVLLTKPRDGGVYLGNPAKLFKY